VPESPGATCRPGAELTPPQALPIVDHNALMNAKLILKTLFFILILLLLVLMGMHNRRAVDFTLPPLVGSVIHQPAAIMYFTFFAIGVLTGTVMTAGKGKRGAKSAKAAVRTEKVARP
jgi:uncharacterized integral membrane protein